MARPTPDQDLPEALLEALRPLQHRLNAQRTLSVGKLGILRHLTRTGRATAGELATRIRVSPQAISLSTRELEGLGLIVRTRDEDDRRRSWFALTDVGRERYEQEHLAGRMWLEKAIDERLGETERRALAAAVPAFRRLAEEDADGC